MFEKIREIDNQKRSLPKLTVIIIAVLMVIGVWFVRGGSFVLYASMFFGLYNIIGIIWPSIILVSLIQNIAFLPLRIIGERLYSRFKDFEAELEATKEDEQYFLFHKKVKEGDRAILIYILNFVLVAIAFISAGRVFLLDFYSEEISRNYLYKFIPYPQYPLQGTILHIPFVEITKTYALDWKTIITFWGIILGMMIIMRLGWKLTRFLLTKNKSLLKIRIAYNRLLVLIGGFIGTLLIVTTIIGRHIPVGFRMISLTADLARQNTTFNIITAVATFLATIYLGYSHNHDGAKEALKRGMAKEGVDKVFKDRMKLTLRNAFLLAAFAYAVTHQMPSSHDISVMAFEIIYIVSPYTIDALLMQGMKKKPEVKLPATETVKK